MVCLGEMEGRRKTEKTPRPQPRNFVIGPLGAKSKDGRTTRNQSTLHSPALVAVGFKGLGGLFRYRGIFLGLCQLSLSLLLLLMIGSTLGLSPLL